MCVEYMMFKEFGLWFPPYKIDSTTKFLVPMATILINNWNIYLWHRLDVHLCDWTLFHVNLWVIWHYFPIHLLCGVTPILGVKLHLSLWGICYEYYMPILSCVKCMFIKCHIAFFTFIYDFLHCSDQLCKSPIHWGWWIYCVIKPYNGTHKDITLFHVHVPIKFHDPIITFKMFIFIIIIGLHIIWNMLWVCKHVQ